MNILPVNYYYADNGNSRIYYKPKDKKDRRLFCTQPDPAGKREWFRCSRGSGEPESTPTETMQVV